jgi:hypothetical protein
VNFKGQSKDHREEPKLEKNYLSFWAWDESNQTFLLFEFRFGILLWTSDDDNCRI